MNKFLVTIICAAMTATASQAQILVAAWDFQTTTTGGSAAVAAAATGVANTTPKIYTANFGTGALYFDGSNGSSNWFLPATGGTNAELNAFGGSSINTSAPDGTLLSSVTTSPAALAVVGGSSASVSTPSTARSAVFKFSMAGKSSLSISLTAQRSATGFSTQLWEFSSDGGSTWGTIGSLIGGSTAGTIRDTFTNTGVLSLGAFSGLDNIADARVKVTFTGATASSGNNRLDNIQLNAVPEPSSSVLMLLGAAGLIGIRAMRRKDS